MGDLLIKVLINAVGVFAAIQVVPMIDFDYGADWWKLLAVALILALVNTWIKPVLKLVSLPINLISLGLFSFVLNALLLLLVAFVSDQLDLGFTVGGFPPEMTSDSFVGAVLASIVISVVSTLLGLVNAGRKVVV